MIESEWLAGNFNKLRIGGVWGWPDAKLVYKKKSEDSVQLISVGPFEPDTWKSAHEWVIKHSDVYEVEDPHELYFTNNG